MPNTAPDVAIQRLDCTDVGLSAFSNAPGSTYFYTSTAHRKVLDDLVKGVRDRLGLLLVLGDFGTGKTTLCNYILMAYAHEFDLAYLGNPFLSEAEFFRHIATELGAEVGEDATAKQAVDLLEEHLLTRHRAGRTVAVFLDEAHLLERDLFDRLLVLSNLQEGGVPLLQIVMVGVPQLLGILSGPRFSSLNQRIGSRHRLNPLSLDETGQYIRQRLVKAGCADPALFDAQAVAAVHELSGGRPRLINLLCRLSLEALAASGQVTVSGPLVWTVSKDPSFSTLFGGDVDEAPFTPPRRKRRLWTVLAGLAVAGVLVFALTGGDGQGPLLPPPPRPLAPALPPPPAATAPEPLAELPLPPQAAPAPESLPAASPRPEQTVVVAEEPEPPTLPEPPEEVAAPEDFDGVPIHAIAWSEDEDDRMAMLGNDVLRIGDVYQGASVEDIVPDAVIFSRDGQRFRLTQNLSQ